MDHKSCSSVTFAIILDFLDWMHTHAVSLRDKKMILNGEWLLFIQFLSCHRAVLKVFLSVHKCLMRWLNRVTCLLLHHAANKRSIFNGSESIKWTNVIFFQTAHFLARKISSRTSPTKRSTPSPTRGKASTKDCGRLRTTQKLSSLHPRYVFLLRVSSKPSRRWP